MDGPKWKGGSLKNTYNTYNMYFWRGYVKIRLKFRNVHHEDVCVCYKGLKINIQKIALPYRLLITVVDCTFTALHPTAIPYTKFQCSTIKVLWVLLVLLPVM